ncbi:MAG: VWA domain-containing protein [Lentisphaeria bacterium]|nr:VWA domain-containing protein [Lentisphaeria bacterium]
MKKLSLFILTGWVICFVAQGARLTLTAELQEEVIPAETAKEAMLKISVMTPELETESQTPRVNINLAVVLDKSGSMTTRGKLENAKEAAVTALRMLGEDDYFSLVTYDSQARTLIPARKAGDKAGIEKMIRAIQADGNTALFAGVALGANEIRKHRSEEYVNRMIVLSDGLANVGPCAPKELGGFGASLIKEGISVSTIGVGGDYNEDLMTALSQASDGHFYFVENSHDLPLIFTQEMGAALRVTAKALTIHIEFPDGVVPVGVLGRDCKVVDNKMAVYFNQVYGGHEKSLIIQVSVPPKKAAERIDLASIRMSYQDAFSGENLTLTRTVSAVTSADIQVVEASYNQDVGRDVSLVNNAVMKQQAIEQADQGNWDVAQKILSESTRQLEEAAQKTGDQTLAAEVARNLAHEKEMAENQRRGSFDNRKVLKGESFQDLNGQFYKQNKPLRKGK